MNQSFEIKFETKRCFTCGRYWAHEIGFQQNGAPSCPFCAGIDIEKANARVAAAERAKNSLRGALTKAKQKSVRQN